MRYFKGTANLKLSSMNGDVIDELFGYADANWAEDRSDRKSLCILCKLNYL